MTIYIDVKEERTTTNINIKERNKYKSIAIRKRSAKKGT
jgi:hypothetical protein